MSQPVSPRLQQVIDMVESLPPDDQRLVIEMIYQKVKDRRAEMAAKIAEARQPYQGQVRQGKMLQMYRTETIVSSDGILTIIGLPFHAGDKVEVIVRDRQRERTSGQDHPLRGKPIRYTDPFESVAEDDWEVLK